MNKNEMETNDLTSLENFHKKEMFYCVKKKAKGSI